MKRISAILLLSLSITCWCQETTTETASTPKPVGINKNLRQALLKALAQLEKEEAEDKIKIKFSNPEKVDLDDSDPSDDEDNHQVHFIVKSRNKTNQKEVKEKENVFVHSYTADEESSTARNYVELQTFKNQPLNVVDISASATTNFKTKQPSTKPSKIKVTTPTPVLSTPTPTVITPVDEEDQSSVKVEDVQFIHAPLVAAFTVQQDEKGLPQKVIPIYGSKTTTKRPTTENTFSDHFQVAFDKQKNLEIQLQILQEQQRRQELLRQQQELQIRTLQEQRQRTLQEQRQRTLQEQRQRTLEDQYRQKQLEDQRLNQQRFKSQELSFTTPKTIKNTGTLVSLQPSISLEHSFSNPTNAPVKFNLFNGNQVPIREAVDFRQEPFLYQHVLNQIRGNNFNVDNLAVDPNFNRDNSFTSNLISKTLLPPRQSNRVFRHESGVGNLGINSQSNRVFRHETSVGNAGINDQSNRFTNGFNVVQAPSLNRFHNFRQNAPSVDARIKNLIYQSGFNDGRSQEDINLVSEVLALDHVPIGNFQTKFNQQSTHFQQGRQTNFVPFKF